MPQRHRYANRAELVALLAEHINTQTGDSVDETTVDSVLQALVQHEVNVEALVKTTVDEDVTPDLQ
jgi:hypothetical protein